MSKFFEQRGAEWTYNAAVGRAWDYSVDVYEYQQQGELKVLTVDGAGLELSTDAHVPTSPAPNGPNGHNSRSGRIGGDGSDAALRRRRLPSVTTDADSHVDIDLSAYARHAAPVPVRSRMMRGTGRGEKG